MHPIRCWRPPYWEIFPSLPDYTLPDVLGTVGRAPKDEAERQRFSRWRDGSLLMKPEAMPQRPRPLPAPVIEPPAVPPNWRLIVGLGALTIALLISWFA